MSSPRCLYALAALCFILVTCGLDDEGPADSVGLPQVYVNEFLAASDTSDADPDFEDFADWIEIYNAETEAVELGGMYLTDDLDEPRKWSIPAGAVVPASGYIVFWADDEDTSMTAYHTSFKLSKGGESIGLFSTDATGNRAIDTVTFDAQEADVSFGRSPDGAATWQTFSPPTPGHPNN